MVERTQAVMDTFVRKIIFTVQGKGGKVEPFLNEVKNVGFVTSYDPYTHYFHMNYPYQNKTEYHKIFSNLEAYTGIENTDETLMLFYFSGESLVKGGKIVVDLGAGPQPIEKNIFSLCERATNLTTWAIWDCDRSEIETERSTSGRR